MNKTVTINISGIIFNIDEEAFNKLHKYLETIKSYFKNSEGTDEIMADIEARIAEMFQEKLNTKNQVVSIKDVDEVIAVMGEPEDYLDPDMEPEYTQEKSYQYTESTSTRRKKLYRDPDNKVAGGVCSGIGHYFDLDPVIFRVLFVVAFLTLGSGFFLYIILWIIIPEAKTTAEKLEMKGESVTIDNIKKKVEEEAENLKNRFNEFREKNGPAARKTTDKLTDFVGSFFRFVFSIVALFFKFIAKFIGIVFLIAGSIALVALLVSVFTTSRMVTAATSNGMVSYSLTDLTQVFFNSGFDSFIGILGVILVAGVPLALLLIAGLKILFRDKIKARGLGLIAAALWGLGFIATIYAGVSTLSEFSNQNTQEKVINLDSKAIKNLKLEVKSDGSSVTKYSYRNGRFNFRRDEHFKIEDGKMQISSPTLNIQPSEDSTYKLVILNTARGNSSKEAAQRAEAIEYNFSLKDSTLSFEPYFSFSVDNKWRNQEVKLTLLVPPGKSVFIDKSAGKIIYDIENISNTWDSDMLGKKWTMLNNGLACVNCFDGWEGKEEKDSN